MTRRTIDPQRPNKSDDAHAYDDLFDPPSLGDRPTPIPADRVMVIGDVLDDGHDAPTVAVRDLAMLGIDISDLQGTAPNVARRASQTPRRPPTAFDTPESSPVRDLTPEFASKASAPAPTASTPSALTLVTAAAIPLVLGCCVAAGWMIAA